MTGLQFTEVSKCIVYIEWLRADLAHRLNLINPLINEIWRAHKQRRMSSYSNGLNLVWKENKKKT